MINTRFALRFSNENVIIPDIQLILINFLFAKKYKGSFYLRNYNPYKSFLNKDKILEQLKKLGLADVIFYETRSFEIYNEAIVDLLKSGNAYTCSYSDDAVKMFRHTNNHYVHKGFHRTQSAADNLSLFKNHGARLKIDDRYVFQDVLRGPTEYFGNLIDDPLIIDKNYHSFVEFNFYQAVEDINQGIGIVVDSEVNLFNSFIQSLFIFAFGHVPPIYIHLPRMNVNKVKPFTFSNAKEALLSVDAKKRMNFLGFTDCDIYTNRHYDTSNLDFYFTTGFPNQAIINYLLQFAIDNANCISTLEEASEIIDIHGFLDKSATMFWSLDGLYKHGQAVIDTMKTKDKITEFSKYFSLPEGNNPCTIFQLFEAFHSKPGTFTDLAFAFRGLFKQSSIKTKFKDCPYNMVNVFKRIIEIINDDNLSDFGKRVLQYASAFGIPQYTLEKYLKIAILGEAHFSIDIYKVLPLLNVEEIKYRLIMAIEEIETENLTDNLVYSE